MEKQIFTKFSLYDQIGYFMVGFVALGIIYFDANTFLRLNFLNSYINNPLFLIISAYFLGHFNQALANILNKFPYIKILLREDREEFNQEQKKTLKIARKFFNVDSSRNHSIWNLCYSYALTKDPAGQIEAFNAYYGMYRGWFVIFISQTIFQLFILFATISVLNSLFFVASIIITIIFYIRTRRFWNYLKDKVLQTFIVVKR